MKAKKSSAEKKEKTVTGVKSLGKNKRPGQTKKAETTETGFPVVGIGTSAGGLAAFEAFFSAMPAAVDPGMAFVLVQHLAPDHESILIFPRFCRHIVKQLSSVFRTLPGCYSRLLNET